MPDQKFIEITECPRDAMQGWPAFIPTQKKIRYLQNLLNAGFQNLDFGSFVSAKSIPQMADTKEVVSALNPNAQTKLLAITANLRGAAEAVQYDNIDKIGFPFSVSETFQLRNTNSSIATSFETVREIQELCLKNNKTLVVYLSMGFGNPYGDFYSEDMVLNWVENFLELNISDLSIADTVGLASAEQVNSLLDKVGKAQPTLQIGVHLHAAKETMIEKLDAALLAGCTRFDSAIKGIGGCPMSGSDLVGNIDTEIMIDHFHKKGYSTSVDMNILATSSRMASDIFI